MAELGRRVDLLRGVDEFRYLSSCAKSVLDVPSSPRQVFRRTDGNELPPDGACEKYLLLRRAQGLRVRQCHWRTTEEND